jgi:hypothetical protein
MISAENFINLSKRQAQNLAEANYMIFRLISDNGENILGYPEDTRNDRVCVKVENERVTEAIIQ